MAEVTLKDVYDAVHDLEDKIDKRVAVLEERVHSLEGFQNKAIGILGLLSFVISVSASFVWSKLKI